jgi:hypothetical protein
LSQRFTDPELEDMFQRTHAEDYCLVSHRFWGFIFIIWSIFSVYIWATDTKQAGVFFSVLWGHTLISLSCGTLFLATGRFMRANMINYFEAWSWATAAMFLFCSFHQNIMLVNANHNYNDDKHLKMFWLAAHFMLEIQFTYILGWLTYQFTVVYILLVSFQWYILISGAISVVPFRDSFAIPMSQIFVFIAARGTQYYSRLNFLHRRRLSQLHAESRMEVEKVTNPLAWALNDLADMFEQRPSIDGSRSSSIDSLSPGMLAPARMVCSPLFVWYAACRLIRCPQAGCSRGM